MNISYDDDTVTNSNALACYLNSATTNNPKKVVCFSVYEAFSRKDNVLVPLLTVCKTFGVFECYVSTRHIQQKPFFNAC